MHEPLPVRPVLWLTGLSGAGKSTIANLVHAALVARGEHAAQLDGDVLRRGLNRDLGFADTDRSENIRRVAEVALLMSGAGVFPVVALISPFRRDRAAARALFAPGLFLEVFIDTPLSVAEKRDPKGLYRRARAGLLPGMTGIDSRYEPPEAAEVVIDTTTTSADTAADRLVRLVLGTAAQ